MKSILLKTLTELPNKTITRTIKMFDGTIDLANGIINIERGEVLTATETAQLTPAKQGNVGIEAITNLTREVVKEAAVITFDECRPCCSCEFDGFQSHILEGRDAIIADMAPTVDGGADHDIENNENFPVQSAQDVDESTVPELTDTAKNDEGKTFGDLSAFSELKQQLEEEVAYEENQEEE